MAITRDSKPVTTRGSGRQPELVGPQGARFENPNPRKFMKPKSGADALIDSMIPVAKQAAQAAWDNQLEEEYLNGVTQAAKGVSEANLEASPLTRDWAKAGHRDTQGRMVMAESMQHVQNQMKLIVGKPDAQDRFTALMDEQNAKVTAAIQGMSRQQRAASFAQQANDIIAQQSQFTKMRAAWLVEQEQQSITADFTVRRNRLDASKDDPDNYLAESRAFSTAIYKNVWQNPKLPYQNRIDMTKQAIEYAASSDNVGVYDMLKNMEFDFEDGSTGTIMSRMPFEEQVALDKVHRQAMGRTAGLRAASFEDSMARHRAQWAEGAPEIGYTELSGMLNEAQDHGLLNQGKRESVLKEYFTAVAKSGGDGRAALMYSSGDYSGLSQLGVSEEQGLKAWLQTNKELPLNDKVQALLAIGHNGGWPTAYKEVGTLVAPAIATLGYQKEIDPEGASTVHGVVQAIEIAEGTNPGVATRTLQALTDESQDMVLHMREAQRKGITDPIVAVEYARDQIDKANRGGGVVERARTQARTDDAKAVQEIGDRQLLGSLSLGAKAFFSQNAEARQRLGTRRAWFENPDRTAEIHGYAQMELAYEMDVLSQTSPFLSSESRMSKGLANLANRTIDTESGPLILPRGADIHTYFGAPKVADQEYIGKAIDEMVPLADGERIAWTQAPGGALLFQRFAEDGTRKEAGSIDPKSVGVKVQENLNRDADLQANYIGPGITMRDGTAKVQFNGENTAGAPPKYMLALREDLVKSEGIRNVSYGDGSVVKGNKAFGVGVSQSGGLYEAPLNPDGTYRQEQIDRSFTRASNNAAEVATRTMATLGLEGPDWFRFLGEMAYQSPASARNEDMLAHIALGDFDQALTAMKNTNAYKNSPPARQATYEAKLRKAMR